METAIDILSENHELISYDLDREEWWQWLDVGHDGETLWVRVPEIYDGGVERIVRVDRAGDRLYLIGEVGHDYDGRGRIGCLVVARPCDDGTWVTILFHALYPLSITGVA